MHAYAQCGSEKKRTSWQHCSALYAAGTQLGMNAVSPSRPPTCSNRLRHVPASCAWAAPVWAARAAAVADLGQQLLMGTGPMHMAASLAETAAANRDHLPSRAPPAACKRERRAACRFFWAEERSDRDGEENRMFCCQERVLLQPFVGVLASVLGHPISRSPDDDGGGGWAASPRLCRAVFFHASACKCMCFYTHGSQDTTQQQLQCVHSLNTV